MDINQRLLFLGSKIGGDTTWLGTKSTTVHCVFVAALCNSERTVVYERAGYFREAVRLDKGVYM